MLQKERRGRKRRSLTSRKRQWMWRGLGPASANNSTRVGLWTYVNFADVRKMEGDACPIVHASAISAGCDTDPSFQGGNDGMWSI